LPAALRDRSWPGDQVAVESLTSVLSGTSTGRAGLVVDLDELGDVLSDECRGYAGLATGGVWPALDRHEAHWVDWRVWSSERRMGRAREWLADEGYDPIP
jgi:hypothetical protein